MKESLKIYSRLLGYVKPYWKFAMLMIVTTAIYSSTNAIYVSKFKVIIDEGFIQKNLDAIIQTIIVLVLVTIFRGISFFMSNYASRRVSSNIVYDLRLDMFSRLHRLPSSYYHHVSSGNILSKFNYEVLQVTEAITSVTLTLIREGFLVVVILGYLLYQDWKLTLTMIVVFPVIAIIIRIVSKRLRELAQRLQVSMGKMNHILDENIKGQQLVKLFNSADYEQKKFRSASKRIRDASVKSEIANSLSTPTIEMMIVTVMAIVIWLSALQVKEGSLTPGSFLAYIIMMGLLPSAVKKLTRVNEHLQKGVAASEAIFQFLDELLEQVDREKTSLLPYPIKGEVRFKNVCFSYYGKHRESVLTGFNLTIKAGETVAIVGSSGSGKSSLARLIPRFYDIKEGEILLDGINIKNLSLTELRDNIAFVNQETILFDDSILANIAYGDEVPDLNRVEQAAKVAFAHDFIMTLESGYHYQVGEQGQNLSGGQKQRLAIARAIYKDAPVMIFDEATSALDNKSEKLVQKALESLIKDKTAIVIAHRLSTVRHADRIIVLDKGVVSEMGSHTELLQKQGKYYALHKNTIE